MSSMALKDMEGELRRVMDHHLTEAELDAYLDQGLDKIGMARVKAHLKNCLYCEEGLKILEEERAELGQEITADDIALAKRLIQQVGLQREPAGKKPAQATTGLSLSEWLAQCVQQAVKSWEANFREMKAVRRGHGGADVWQWKSEDGSLKGHATLKKNGDLTIEFSSDELDWDGQRLKVGLGSFIGEITLQRTPKWEVVGSIEVPLRERPQRLEDISIEVV